MVYTKIQYISLFHYLRQGGYVFASVSLCVCLSVCLCVINITQNVTDQFLRKF